MVTEKANEAYAVWITYTPDYLRLVSNGLHVSNQHNGTKKYVAISHKCLVSLADQPKSCNDIIFSNAISVMKKLPFQKVNAIRHWDTE